MTLTTVGIGVIHLNHSTLLIDLHTAVGEFPIPGGKDKTVPIWKRHLLRPCHRVAIAMLKPLHLHILSHRTPCFIIHPDLTTGEHSEIIDHPIRSIVLGNQPHRACLDTQIDIFGDQNHITARILLLQRHGDGKNPVITIVARK